LGLDKIHAKTINMKNEIYILVKKWEEKNNPQIETDYRITHSYNMIILHEQ